jgi:hypothetical protein
MTPSSRWAAHLVSKPTSSERLERLSRNSVRHAKAPTNPGTRIKRLASRTGERTDGTPDAQSGWHERVVPSARHVLVPLPPGLDVADASLVEPGSVAWHSCHQGEIGPQTRVAMSERAP